MREALSGLRIPMGWPSFASKLGHLRCLNRRRRGTVLPLRRRRRQGEKQEQKGQEQKRDEDRDGYMRWV